MPDTPWGLGDTSQVENGFRPEVQSPALSKHHYPVKPLFSVPLAVLGQGGAGYLTGSSSGLCDMNMENVSTYVSSNAKAPTENEQDSKNKHIMEK